MDFFHIKEKDDEGKKGIVTVYPDFRVVRSKDLMVRAKSFYAIWDEENNIWSQDEFEVQRLMDKEISAYPVQAQAFEVRRKLLGNFSSNSWLQFRNYMGHLSDSYTQLDEKLTFSNTEVKKEDFVSRRLPYPLEEGTIHAYDELMNVLYEPDERAKLEWAIGAVVSGDSKSIQKFIVLYGAGGTGKSTVLNIIMWLFEGYTAVFEAKSLAGSNNLFSTEAFRHNPLVAIQHDGDLSKIEDNTKLNSIISHEDMLINEKNKPSYMMAINAFLFMGTNKPVHITDSKSGIIRRLIDVHPTGEKIAPRRYQTLMSQIKFELGAIAHHCLKRYQDMGKDFYSQYRPVEMMLQTDVFYNFIEAYYDVFSGQEGITLQQAYKLYKEFVDDTNVPYKLAQYKFREELRNYFEEFLDRYEMADGTRVRSFYKGFSADRFKVQPVKNEMVFTLSLDSTESIFDKEFEKQPAQYSNANGNPKLYWTDAVREDKNGKEFTPKPNQVCSTTLADLDTSKEHYVKVPLNHIVIDFDLTDDNGDKSMARNLEAASQWPTTYAELSKSGGGVHLHYNYEGDVNELSRVFEDGIEIKVYSGDSSLRRRLTKCNNVPVATINSGLPLKEKKVINNEAVKTERGLRDLIMRNLRKEIHPGTKPSIDFIHHILKEAHASGLTYDVTDLRPRLMAFANNSTHQGLACLKLVMDMKLASEDVQPPGKLDDSGMDERKLAFFDCEVFPNLFVICWKYEGGSMVRMINPTAQAVEELFKLLLVGYNCRKYDNHILYAASLGYNNEQLYKLSKRLIDNEKNATFGAAYNISYTDIFDYLSEKKSLKKWEIELGLKHSENEFDWDQPVPEEQWEDVADYCSDDVDGTEGVYLARKQDFVARQILAELSGLSMNSSTQQHTARIVFGDDRRPQEKFVYTDLSETFPGYTYGLNPETKKNESSYRGENPSEGGYVFGKPGIYHNVAVLDVASMHPTSIGELNLFGPYTQGYTDLMKARVAIKRRNFEALSTVLDGKLKPFVEAIPFGDGQDEALDALSFALKIVINIVYGLTSASFENAFRDPRNVDNIVAKRGALFMIELKNAVLEGGYEVVHIKTDSIKIANATQEVIDFIMEFGKRYGYDFEHEATYEKMALVNNAVYIARVAKGKKPAHWEATGAEFAHPFVFKTLFSHEQIQFRDLAETKSVVKGALYLDYEGDETAMALMKDKKQFIGKVGSFIPVTAGGGTLLRIDNEKEYAVAGSKGYRWLETEFVDKMNKRDDVDYTYYQKLVDSAADSIRVWGDFEAFVTT